MHDVINILIYGVSLCMQIERYFAAIFALLLLFENIFLETLWLSTQTDQAQYAEKLLG